MLGLEEVLLFFGRAICHQLPERSFIADGKYLPLCARNTGIYIGVFSSLLFLFISKRYRAATIPSVKISLCLLMMLMPLIIDGLGSYLHIYESNNVNRLVTGILFGTALPFFLVPLLHHRNMNEGEMPVIRKLSEIVYPLSFAAVIGALTFYSFLPFFAISTLLIFTSICWFVLIFFTLSEKIIGSTRRAIFLSVCGSFMTLTILSVLHELMLVKGVYV